MHLYKSDMNPQKGWAAASRAFWGWIWDLYNFVADFVCMCLGATTYVGPAILQYVK
jgi:hypothetical protein